MDRADEAVTRLLANARGLLEMVAKASQRRDIHLVSLKAQTFDLLYEALAATAHQLAGEPTTPAPLATCARELAEQIATFQRAFRDVRLHLIELTQDWRCAKCRLDVAKAITLAERTPLSATITCRNCGARSPLTVRGEGRLRAWYGESVSSDWDATLHGFLVLPEAPAG